MGLKILVVDDEERICDLFTRLIHKEEKHKLLCANNGKEALELLEKEKFDIVFLDIVMPVVSGIKILGKIKSSSPNTRVIMMTGKTLDGDLVNEIIKNKADGCLKKPFNIDEVLKIIKDITNNS